MLIETDKLQAYAAERSSEGTTLDIGLPQSRRPRVVIVGGGFAGLSAARALAGTAADVILIDRNDYHLFQPLLTQVATASLSPADIAAPLRTILSRQANASVIQGEVTGIDTAQRIVRLGHRDVPYDYLVLATGARHSTSGRDGRQALAPGLKTIEDAVAIRSRILRALEQADATDDEAERRRLATFVIVGAGPTGVELAGSVAELVRTALARDFRRIDPAMARVVLVEAQIRVLPSSRKSFSSMTRRALQDLGVELRLGVPVSECDAEGIVLAGKRLASATVLWAAGVAASPAAAWLDAASDPSGRVIVEHDLSVPGHLDIVVVGDTAHVAEDGQPLPGVAPVAKQQGDYAARVIAARVAGKKAPAPFHYRNAGTVATIGRKSAVAQFGALQLSGRLAWLLWGAVHIYFLIGFRNRMAAMLDLVWAHMTFPRGARRIAAASAFEQPVSRADALARFGVPAVSRAPQPAPVARRGNALANRELVLEH